MGTEGEKSAEDRTLTDVTRVLNRRCFGICGLFSAVNRRQFEFAGGFLFRLKKGQGDLHPNNKKCSSNHISAGFALLSAGFAS